MPKKKIKKIKCLCGLPFDVCGHAKGPEDQNLPDFDVKDKDHRAKR